MKPRSARQSANQLARAVQAGNTFRSDVDYRVCGVKAGDLLVYDKFATPAVACGLVVVLNPAGEMRVANFLAYEPAAPDASLVADSEPVKAGEICISEWDGKRIRFIGGTAYPVTHVVIKCATDRSTIVALDLGLDSPDDMMACKILLDAARTFGAKMPWLDNLAVLADRPRTGINARDRIRAHVRRASSMASR